MRGEIEGERDRGRSEAMVDGGGGHNERDIH